MQTIAASPRATVPEGVFRAGALLNPDQLASEFTTIRNAPGLRRYAVHIDAVDSEVQALESTLVPRGVSLAIHARPGAAGIIELALQAAGTLYRMFLPVFSEAPVAWLDEVLASDSCLLTVDITDRGQLALIQALVTPDGALRDARARLDAEPDVTDDLVGATAAHIVRLATSAPASLVNGVGVERVEVVVIRPLSRSPSVTHEASNALH